MTRNEYLEMALRDFIRAPLDNPLTRGDMMTASRMALIALEAKPVGYRRPDSIPPFNSWGVPGGEYQQAIFTFPPATNVIELPKLVLSATTKGEREEMIDVRNSDIKAIMEAGYPHIVKS